MKTTLSTSSRFNKAALAMLFILFIGMTAQAQSNNVYMCDGSKNVGSGTINFYDSGGQSSGPEYYWERWFQRNEHYTYTFKPLEEGRKIKVTFKKYTAYLDTGGSNHSVGNDWSLRLNTATLSFYDGETALETNLITTYTGNMTNEFSVIANGAMTVKFDSYSYREEGWTAEVTAVNDYEMQAPQISFEVCSDAIVINQNNKDAVVYYQLNNQPDPNDPLQGNPTEYQGPFSVDPNTTIYAFAKLDNVYSAIISKTFTANDVTPTPGVPTITRTENTITMTPAAVNANINETYYVWYTTDGSDPDATHGQQYTTPIEWNTPGTTFKAVTRATSCNDKMSTVVTLEFEHVKVPTPTITFTNGGATIACTMDDVTIYYTTDGSTPTSSSAQYTAPFTVTYGTTVKAIAVKNVSTGYENSDVASAVYVPEGGSGVGGGVVILDDREDHSWSYYSDGDQPVHSLKPADVKITYYGTGENTMTTDDTSDNPTTFDADVDNTQVGVGPDAPASCFVYLKTIENANEDGSGNYPYTLIPNPFSVRPTGESGTQTITAESRVINISWTRSANNVSGTLVYSYIDADGVAHDNISQTINGNSSTQITAKVGSRLSYTLSRTSNRGSVSSTISYADDHGTNQIWNVTVNSNTPSSGNHTVIAGTSITVPFGEYRGFYAWRVKRLSGVTIQRANGSSVGVNGIINAEEEIEFVAAPNSTDNEVDFEALWAQAYVVTSNTATGLHAGVSYERNFIVGTTASSVGVPVTYSSYYPDGTSAGTASVNGFTCEADTKFEYMTISGGTFTAANNDLIMGRGLTGTASRLRGIGAAATNLDYTIRVESGTYTNFSFVNEQGSGNVSGRYFVKSIMGCDYDRAQKDNSKLSVSPNAQLFYSTNVTFGGSGNKDQKTFDCVFKSGSYQSGYWGNNVTNNGDYQHSAYLGQNSAGNTYPGMRYVTVEGGEFGSMNGGRGVGSESETYASPGVVTFDLRIKGGLFHGCVYGAAADNPSIGSRRMVVTGGEIRSWLAGGCNGTGSTSNSGATNGNSFIYVGGNAVIGGSNASEINGTAGGQVFGAGRGLAGRAGSMIISNVVVADNANISNNVYGGGYNSYIVNTSNVHILGGILQSNVFGGSYGNGSVIPTSNVYVKGGTVNGSVYGGSNSTGTVTNSHVTMNGGETTNVFGGGLGVSTIIGNSTTVTIDGGTISKNVYGGGEDGVVNGNTNVTVSGGKMNDVFGAGMGKTTNAPINGQTSVTIRGGEIVNVYGGGEAGDVVNGTNLASTVTIAGGTVSGDVFGGGKMGKTTGNTIVNLESGNVRGYLYGGAYGETGSVFVAGTHTVNIMGGRVFGSVYGGSRNADDALAFTGYSTTEDRTSSVINISAGQVDEQVYVAGYFGRTYGSVYAFVGKEAILNAPHNMPSFGNDNETKYKAGNLHLEHNIWAGADFGDFSGGGFGGPTVSGYSDIYVDGDGYDTQTTDASANTYMDIKGSIYGCGTSCDAGTKGRGIYVSNYGHVNAGGSKADDFNEPYVDATRDFESIQRADTLVINNSHINFKGQGMVYTTDATNKYAIVSFDKTVRIVGGSSIFMNAPATQIFDFWSASVDNIYAKNPVYTALTIDDLGDTENKIRVNGGNYIEIYHDKMIEGSTPGYGMLNGFAYMMVAASNSDNTCAYARPKWCEDTPIEDEINNANDGGWVSYNSDNNTYALDGTAGNDQMPYENHKNPAKNGEQYFRIWRAGGEYSEREAVVTAQADGSNTFSYVDVTVNLPAWRDANSYYMFQTTGEAPNYNTTINYGSDVMMFNSAMTGDDAWIHYDVATHAQVTGAITGQQDEISGSPNVNFGLFIMPGAGMNLNNGADDGLIVCNESDPFLASVGEAPDYVPVNQFNCDNFEQNPKITFRLTYSNRISTNTTWDPMFVTLVQVDESGKVTDIVRIDLIISTATSINQEFITQTYAVMNGTGSPTDQYTAKVVLPSFDLFDYSDQDLSVFTITDIQFAAENGGEWVNRGEAGGYGMTKFAMEVGPAANEDNTNGWDHMSTGMTDTKTFTSLELGKTGARTPFAIDFRLNYKGDQTYEGTNPRLGVLTFTIQYTNAKVPTLDPATGQPQLDGEGNPIYHEETRTLTIKVEVIRRGRGAAFYLDGVNGSNANNGRYPDKAALALSTIFNRLDFKPGDVVYVVNTVSTGELTLEWSGTAFDNVTLYRYPGGHPLSQTQKKDAQGNALFIDNETGQETTASTTNGVLNEPVMIEGEIVDNPDNEAFLGNLVIVNNKGRMVIRDITLDGHKSTHTTTVHSVTDPAITSDTALISVETGGLLTLSNGVMLQENNCTTDGAAVALNGTLRMNENAKIMNNVTLGNGGGVYMNGTMIVSDSVQVVNNTKGTVENNVFLPAATSMIQIGTSAANDGFEALTDDAEIGVTKELYADVDGYTRVVNVETSNEIPWLEVPYTSTPNAVIYHDGHKYQLVKYTTGNGSAQILYWIGTWVTVQDHEPTEEEGGWTGIDNIGNITTPYQLAWVISLVNGENGCTPNDFSGKTIVLNNDIDMSYSIWVPIGTTNTNFKGTFDGNGHVITGIKSPLVNANDAMFGITNGATIQNAIVQVNLTGNSNNMGAFIGTMNNGSLLNVEAAGTLEGNESTANIGGLVGLNNGGTIHSSFAVNTITAEKAETIIGGLVGTNGGDLFNSYANVTLGQNNVATTKGGLVGVNNNNHKVENCYVINPIGPAFAAINNGTIQYCYAAEGISSYVGEGNTPSGHGNYGAVKGIKEIGYMYGDNLIEKGTNTYVGNNSVTDNGGLTTYIDNHTSVWNGLLSALNQWVRGNQGKGYSTWNRPTSQAINGDLPILAFPMDNSLATTDGKFLRYSASDEIVNGVQANNGLDKLFTEFASANIYLYNSAINVVNGSGSNNLFIHEDAALIQAESSKDMAKIKATSGVTFDNSHKNASDYFGNQLMYDWHLMSSPFVAAPMGITYTDEDEHNWWEQEDTGQVSKVEGSYMPDNIQSQTAVKWDLYTYYEPQYHWINFKRNSASHFHYDDPHGNIEYENESIFVPGKGYMMAISQDSYLNNTGILNNNPVDVTLTFSDDGSSNEPTKDWGSNLVGNPYQAYLDLNKVADKTQYTKYYVYIAEQNQYKPFVIGQSTNTATPSQYIHPHQAFFVLTDATDSNFQFTYDMATATKEDHSYFRKGDHIDYPLINLFVNNEAGAKNYTTIEVGRPELGGAEKTEALKTTDFEMYARYDQKDYKLLFTPEDAHRVAVFFSAKQDGTYTLTWDTQNGEFSFLRLIDNIAGVEYDMTHNDHYTFEAHATDFASRFYILFNNPNYEPNNDEGNGSFAYNDGYGWIINGEGILELIDVTGRVLYKEYLAGDMNRVQLDNFKTGVYVMKLGDQTQKIIIR